MKHETLPTIVCGTENELAIRAWDMHGRLLTNGELYGLTLEAMPNGLYVFEEFLPNAGRYYYDHIYNSDKRDSDGHLEVATPECGSIEEAVIYDFSADDIVLGALDNLVEKEEVSKFDFHKRVSDENGQYWGAHENYLTELELDPESGGFYHVWAAHLATRSVLTGAGRVSRKGFNIAQKIRALNTECSWTAHSDRPLVDLRHTQKPLTVDSEAGHRIQVSCGDANVSPWALRMRLGTSALVIRMQEQGVPLSDLALEDPLSAAFIVGDDVTLNMPLELANGKSMRAVDVQHELALRAVRLAEKTPLPDEEREIAAEWLKACELLKGDDRDALLGKVDWLTKKYGVDKLPILPRAKNLAQRRMLDFEYDRIGETEGLGIRLRDKGLIETPFSSFDILKAMVEPPQNTRANIRGKVVQAIHRRPELAQRVNSLAWQTITLDGTEIELGSRTTYNPVLQKIIDYATS